MEQQKSTPADWVGKEFQGFVINAAFSDENTKKIMSWLEGLNALVAEGIYTMKPEALHITVLDWVAPLFDYGGADKRALFAKVQPSYDAAFRQFTRAMSPFEVHFSEIRVTSGTIILVGQDDGQFQTLRDEFTQKVTLPEGGKQPPNIIHSSLARFIEPAIDETPIQEYASSHPLDFSQHISAFRLVETRREPMQDFSVLDSYQLGG